MFTVNNKFNIGQIVYLIVQDYLPNSCNTCDEDGEITLHHGEKWSCPICFGDKRNRYLGRNTWRVFDEPLVVNAIYTTYNSRRVSIQYKLSSTNGYNTKLYEYLSTSTEYESKLFATEEEALAECKRRNGES
jgi:hypothetical protein